MNKFAIVNVQRWQTGINHIPKMLVLDCVDVCAFEWCWKEPHVQRCGLVACLVGTRQHLDNDCGAKTQNLLRILIITQSAEKTKQRIYTSVLGGQPALTTPD